MKIDIHAIIERVIDGTNNYFTATKKPLRIEKMSQPDFKKCVSRSMRSHFKLAWSDYSTQFEDADSYSFCFKLTSDDINENPVPDRPEGGCISVYNIHDKRLSIEIIQSFDQSGGVLDGYMMAYSLVSIYLFLFQVEGDGVYLNNPVNDEVRQYYINTFGFKIIDQHGMVLFLSFEKLNEFYISQSSN